MTVINYTPLQELVPRIWQLLIKHLSWSLIYVYDSY